MDTPPRRFILCADDFGFTAGVSKGILELVARSRLSAVSCMTTTEAFPVFGPDLKLYKDQVDTGLHVTLTGLTPLGPVPCLEVDGTLPDMGTVTNKALTGRLNREEITAEIERQIDRFIAVMGFPPDFIDGHHHVQQLPIIRDCILDLVTRRFPAAPPYLRVCRERVSTILNRGLSPGRALAIGWFGGALARRAAARGVPVTGGFSGVYDFSDRHAYDGLFARFIRGLRKNSLVMCHPGYADDDLRARDSLTDQREVELAFFRSDAFAALLQERHLALGRFEHGAQRGA